MPFLSRFIACYRAQVLASVMPNLMVKLEIGVKPSALLTYDVYTFNYTMQIIKFPD